MDEAAAQLAAYRQLAGRAAWQGSPDGPGVPGAAPTPSRRYGIPHEYFYRPDRRRARRTSRVSRYETFDELKDYCYRVASVVGLISIEIFGYSGGEKARGHAADLGIALQLTNILRDIQEDAERGRIYLPLDELECFGYSEADLLRRARRQRGVPAADGVPGRPRARSTTRRAASCCRSCRAAPAPASA